MNKIDPNKKYQYKNPPEGVSLHRIIATDTLYKDLPVLTEDSNGRLHRHDAEGKACTPDYDLIEAPMEYVLYVKPSGGVFLSETEILSGSYPKEFDLQLLASGWRKIIATEIRDITPDEYRRELQLPDTH